MPGARPLRRLVKRVATHAHLGLKHERGFKKLDWRMTEEERMRVLVVDDAQDAAQALAGLLTLDGHATRVAHDAQEALRACEMVEPDCVLIDINLPGMDGLELARQLRERYGKGIVLVAVTGWGEPEARVSSAFSDLDHYLRKPVSQEQLRTLLPPQKD